jgi:hypothetical protein
MKNKEKKITLYEFRIKYNAGADQAQLNNYHYYNAETAKKALSYHYKMINKRGLIMQTLSVERYNRYAKKWEDCSELINQEA